VEDYIVILSLWKRGQWLEEQLEIFKNQTLPPKEIWLCHGLNEENKHFLNSEIFEKFDKVITIEDGGSVFSRFEMAAVSKEKLFLVIDDDMFPTKNYMEKCLEFYSENQDCIIASSGRIFATRTSYFPNQTLGSVNYTSARQVHIGTNGWFLSRDSVNEMLTVHNKKYNNGEDVALSFINLKNRKVKTFVIEQNNKTNSDKYKHSRGVGEEALSHGSKHEEFYRQRNEILSYYFAGKF